MAHTHDLKCLQAGPGGGLVCKYEQERAHSPARVCSKCNGSGLEDGHVCRQCGGTGEIRNGNGNGKVIPFFRPTPGERATMAKEPYLGAEAEARDILRRAEEQARRAAASRQPVRSAPPVEAPRPEGPRYGIFPIRGFLPAAVRAAFLTPKAAMESVGVDQELHAIYEIVEGFPVTDPRSKGRLARMISREGTAEERAERVVYWLSTAKTIIPGTFKIKSGALAFAREHFRQHPKIAELTLLTGGRGAGKMEREILRREDFVGGPQPPEYVVFERHNWKTPLGGSPFATLAEAKKAAERLLASHPEATAFDVRKRVPGDPNYAGKHATVVHRKKTVASVMTEDPKDLSRDSVIRIIRAALRQRSGKDWSVTGGRGTGYGWLSIDAPPRDKVWDSDGLTRVEKFGYMSRERREELGRLLGLGRPTHAQGESIPASSDHYREYIARAQGRTPTVHGQQYWD